MICCHPATRLNDACDPAVTSAGSLVALPTPGNLLPFCSSGAPPPSGSELLKFGPKTPTTKNSLPPIETDATAYHRWLAPLAGPIGRHLYEHARHPAGTTAVSILALPTPSAPAAALQ